MGKKKELERNVVGVATVKATLFYEKPKMKREISSRFGFCMEDMGQEDKESLSAALKAMYKKHIDECISRKEIPSCNKMTCSCSFRIMECDAILNKSNE
ncbi:MAG: hypothetical protein IJ513_04460 [Bacteroidaceae bacterium]|nr:hypothetical protein [Bacteroidaceae bacterium]